LYRIHHWICFFIWNKYIKRKLWVSKYHYYKRYFRFNWKNIYDISQLKIERDVVSFEFDTKIKKNIINLLDIIRKPKGNQVNFPVLNVYMDKLNKMTEEYPVDVIVDTKNISKRSIEDVKPLL